MKRIIILLFIFVFSLGIANAETSTEDLQEIYSQAELLMVQGDYAGAAALYEQLSVYSDAAQMALYCKAVYAADMGFYAVAVDALNSLGQFKDAPQLARYYTACSYLEYAESNVEDNLVQFDLYKELWSEGLIEMFESPEYANMSADLRYCQWAKEIFTELALYKDSLMKIGECDALWQKIIATNAAIEDAELEKKYQDALALEKAGDYQGAAAIYEELGEYKDCPERRATCIAAFHHAQKFNLDAHTGKYPQPFSCGLAAMLIDGYWCFVDKTGNVALHDEWTHVTTFDGGYAWVAKDGVYAMIDVFGNYVSDYDKARDFDYISEHSFRRNTGGIAFQSDMGYVNGAGEVIAFDPEWKNAWEFHEGYAFVLKNGKWGVLDASGTLVLPYEYSGGNYGEGLFILIEGEQLHIYDEQFNQLF